MAEINARNTSQRHAYSKLDSPSESLRQRKRFDVDRIFAKVSNPAIKLLPSRIFFFHHVLCQSLVRAQARKQASVLMFSRWERDEDKEISLPIEDGSEHVTGVCVAPRCFPGALQKWQAMY